MALADGGYQVMLAENGEAALKMYHDMLPSIVITDIKMPGMDGIELLKRIKQENAETEVIMISGHGDMDLAIKSLKHSATDFITKPINVDALEIALHRVQEKIFTREKLKEYTTNLEMMVREKTELQDHLSSLGLMIGSISHGIKGLLTGLDGGMYLLNSGFKKENQEQIREGWDVVRFMVGRIRDMVLDILYYAKEKDLKWETVDVLGFAEEVLKTVGPKIKEQDITLTHRFDPAIGRFQVDAGIVRSALTNIIDNAVEACRSDASDRPHEICFEVTQDAGYIYFNVSDNGIGMDEATRANIFTPFFSSKGERGTGLGLFISNRILSQHGGSISLDSEVDKGSRFSIKIPKKAP